jgi:hypothetical protein
MQSHRPSNAVSALQDTAPAERGYCCSVAGRFYHRLHFSISSGLAGRILLGF